MLGSDRLQTSFPDTAAFVLRVRSNLPEYPANKVAVQAGGRILRLRVQERQAFGLLALSLAVKVRCSVHAWMGQLHRLDLQSS